MKGLPTLIRLRKYELEEKRRKLADLEALRQQIQESMARLEDDIKAEQLIAAQNPEIGFAYGSFAQASIERRRKLETSSQDVMRQIETAAEEVTMAYQELKKYEVAYQAKRKRDTEELNRKEQIRLDDIALEQFRRDPRNG